MTPCEGSVHSAALAGLTQPVGELGVLDFDDVGTLVREQPAEFCAENDHSQVKHPQTGALTAEEHVARRHRRSQVVSDFGGHESAGAGEVLAGQHVVNGEHAGNRNTPGGAFGDELVTALAGE